MKKSTEIIGLPIISISAGMELGSVKSLVVNPEKGTVDFLTVEHDDWQVSVKAIPFRKVIGIGEFALTIDSDNAIIDLNEIPIANQLVNKRIKITDTRVMTRKGQLLGEAKEFFVNEDTGHIIGLHLNVNNQDVFIKSENVLTFGKDILVVKEEASNELLHSAEKLLENSEHEDEDSDEIIEDMSPARDVKEEPLSIQEIDSIKAKQIDLLEGKTVIKDIYGADQQVIIEKGTMLTINDIKKAQDEGPSTFVELSMNTEM
ncbi:PRC-barrel domain-containing protein [Metabacillus halosaccharovorans]|uniref:PRC-barrel domain-containing protein n=1 Tax=Metabacillus halosaccharovorans TaxID=930124 RepID=UPI00203A8DEA|nr:PRC-barrel domain-containing protein [Metabacillus halosaccharovorans]MCM3441955.1 PRC-barrel domain-containing protein [Metabacillus halosaccharovorans]